MISGQQADVICDTDSQVNFSPTNLHAKFHLISSSFPPPPFRFDHCHKNRHAEFQPIIRFHCKHQNLCAILFLINHSQRHAEFQSTIRFNFRHQNFHAIIFPVSYSQAHSFNQLFCFISDINTFMQSFFQSIIHKRNQPQHTGAPQFAVQITRKQAEKRQEKKDRKKKKTGVNNPLILNHTLTAYVLTSSSESLSESTASGNWTTLSLGRSRSLSDQLWRLSTSVAMLPFNRFSASTARQAGCGLQQNKSLPLLFCIMIHQGFFS